MVPKFRYRVLDSIVTGTHAESVEPSSNLHILFLQINLILSSHQRLGIPIFYFV
jgi:hypothetical protein